MKPDEATKRDQQKKLERFYLTKFISDPAHGLRIKRIEDSETPDFILHTLNDLISVELTQLMNPNLKRHEVFQSKVVDMAREIFLSHHPRVSLDVHVTFSNQFRFEKWDPNQVAQELFNEVSKVYQFNKHFKFRVNTPSSSKFRPLSYVDQLYVSNERVFEAWQPFGAFLVDYVDPMWIEDVIQRKELGLRKYKPQYDQNWLLMVCNFGHESSTFRFERLSEKQMATDFDRILIYQYRDDKWFEL
ncbi:MAG: hypothetical protein R2813_08715 [Flavobacteriales bacterium]